MPATPEWLAAIESLLNRGINQSLRAQAAAGRLSGTSMELRIDGFAPIRIASFSGRLAVTTGPGVAGASDIGRLLIGVLPLGQRGVDLIQLLLVRRRAAGRGAW